VVTVLNFLAEQPVLVLFIVIGVGSLIGHVKIKGVGLGAAAVLFLAIGLSAWAASYEIDLEITPQLGTLGLTLFTFTVGIVSGATFFASLRRSIYPILSMVALLCVGAFTAVGMGKLFDLDPALVAGGFAGALTNTPALAAASEAAKNAGSTVDPTVGYAVTYLFGVIGMLIVVQTALRSAAKDTDVPPVLVTRSVRVEITSAPSIDALEREHGGRIKFSRVRHGETSPILAADDRDTLLVDDLVTVVGPADEVDAVTAQLGHTSSHHLEIDRAYLDVRRVTVSSPKVAGRVVGELGLAGRFDATISRVRRGDVDLIASDDFMLQMGDRVRVIAPRARMKEVSGFFGDSSRGLSDITPIVLGLGMTAGILLGVVAFPVPGTVFSIGSAAGTLVIGLILGRIGRIGAFVTAMPFTAAQAISELGLLLFLAQAGTKAGAQIGGAFESGEWYKLLLLGLVVTTVVGWGLFFVMKRVFKMGGTQLSGVVAGSQTQPAVLAFANGRTGHDSRVALGYALVYPAAMITKILLGQVLGGM
jgi:putative transport protein